MSVSRALAWNTGVQIAGKVVSTILGVVIASLMLRYLKQEGFGMYSTANAFFQFFAIILDLGLNVTLVQMLGEHAGDEKKEKHIVSSTFSLRFFTAVILLGIAPFIGLLFPYPLELKIAIFAIWLSFFTTVLNQIVVGVQQRHLKMHIVAIAEILGRVVLIAGIIAGRFLGWGLVPIVFMVSIGSAANFVLNFLLARRYASFALSWDPKAWIEILRRSWPIGVSILFSLVYYKADTFILSLVRSQAEVGVYGAAYRVLEVLVTVPFMFSGVLLPIISNMWAKGNRAQFSHLFGRSLDAITLLAAPLVAGTFILATPGMILVGGSEFAASGTILRIIIFATGFIYFGTVSAHAVVALGLQRKMMPVYIGVALLALGGYALFIPRFGMMAAAWITVLSEFLVAAASTVLALQFSKTAWHPGTAIKAIIAAFVMAYAMRPFEHMMLAIPVAIGMVVYGVLVYASGAVSKQMLVEMMSVRGKTVANDLPLP